ncbi:hypothetical protein MTO96_039814 [Rhipicephalus appendiculatus]
MFGASIRISEVTHPLRCGQKDSSQSVPQDCSMSASISVSVLSNRGPWRSQPAYGLLDGQRLGQFPPSLVESAPDPDVVDAQL